MRTNVTSWMTGFVLVIATACGALAVTDRASDSLVRLPLWLGIDSVLPQIIDAVYQACGAALPRVAA